MMLVSLKSGLIRCCISRSRNVASITSGKFCTMTEGVLVNQNEARRFMEECLEKAGAPPSAAAEQAAVMLEADRQGHYSHGMNRLMMYVNDVLSGACKPSAKPTILKESAGTAWVDGEGALGATVGNFCMDLAVKKAKEAGIGWVVAKHSNHFGIAGWYSMRAINSGMIGMAFTNTSPVMAPTRSKKAALGTNPISVGAPAENGDRFLLDMATTAVAIGKIEIQQLKKEPIPVGWAQDSSGSITTDADLAFASKCLLPLGSEEKTSSYKGYGLATMVELFCGILSGSLYGPHIRMWSHEPNSTEADLGQCFVAIDPSKFAPGFETRMGDLIQRLRGLEPADPKNPVIVPGDKAAANSKKADDTGYIPYHINQIKCCNELSKKLSLKNMQYVK